MRSESAVCHWTAVLLRPRAVFLFRHTSRLGGTRRGDVCHLVMAFVPAPQKERQNVRRTGSP